MKYFITKWTNPINYKTIEINLINFNKINNNFYPHNLVV